jgi:hypothetical protein
MRNKSRTANSYDSITGATVTLNNTDFVTVLAPNMGRIDYKITNDSPHDIIIKEQAFDDPDSTTDIGFSVFKRSVYESPPDNIAVGEISAKAVSGNPEIRVVEV